MQRQYKLAYKKQIAWQICFIMMQLTLLSCQPIMATKYHFKEAPSPEGKFCISQAIIKKNSCYKKCHLKENACEKKQFFNLISIVMLGTFFDIYDTETQDCLAKYEECGERELAS